MRSKEKSKIRMVWNIQWKHILSVVRKILQIKIQGSEGLSKID